MRIYRLDIASGSMAGLADLPDGLLAAFPDLRRFRNALDVVPANPEGQVSIKGDAVLLAAKDKKTLWAGLAGWTEFFFVVPEGRPALACATGAFDNESLKRKILFPHQRLQGMMNLKRTHVGRKMAGSPDDMDDTAAPSRMLLRGAWFLVANMGAIPAVLGPVSTHSRRADVASLATLVRARAAGAEADAFA